MERDEAEVLLILAEELHFGRTAERMRLSRARVSQLVQRLERRVGAPLFVRTSRRVALTALGSTLRDELEPHHRAIDAALERAAASARSVAGVLSVGFSGPPAGETVMRVADAMGSRYPELSVQVCEVPFADPYGGLRSGVHDVQLAELPVGEAETEPDLAAGPVLFTEDRVLAVHASHPLAGRASASMEDLADVPLLTIEGDRLPTACRDLMAPACTPSGRPVPRGPAFGNAQEALVLVAAGKGAWLTAAHAATYHPWPGAVYVPLTDAKPLSYGLLWRETHHTPAIKAFAQLARTAM